jgi:hypothetical protein
MQCPLHQGRNVEVFEQNSSNKQNRSSYRRLRFLARKTSSSISFVPPSYQSVLAFWGSKGRNRSCLTELFASLQSQKKQVDRVVLLLSVSPAFPIRLCCRPISNRSNFALDFTRFKLFSRKFLL